MTTITILPEILKIAQDKNLGETKNVSSRTNEIRFPCPFCQGGDSGFHLYINTEKNIFNCFRCGSRGGVVRFIALLENRAETEVLEEILAEHRKNKPYLPKDNRHPAEKLNAFQLRAMGLSLRPNWSKLREINPGLTSKMLNALWRKWNVFLRYEMESATQLLYLAIREDCGYDKVIEKLKARSRELQHDLLAPALKTLSAENPPDWFLEIKKIYDPILEEHLKNKQKKAATAKKQLQTAG